MSKIKINRRYLIILHDLLMVTAAWVIAWLARFNFEITESSYWNVCFWTLPLVLLIQGALNKTFGLYRGLWRFASLSDLWNIFRAVLLGTISITMVLFFVTRLEAIPRSIFILYPVFLILFLGGARLTYRIWKDDLLSFKTIKHQKEVLIIGAGRAGEMLVRDMLRNSSFLPIGILDDNPYLLKTELHGIKVLGDINSLAGIVKKQRVDCIIIAIPSATNIQMQKIVTKCEEVNISIRTLPNLQEVVTDNPSVKELRELSIEDLLGRERVELDWNILNKGIVGKKIMVTGGGGSIGSELCHQIASLRPMAIIIMEQNEFNLYKINASIRKNYPELTVHLVLGDICDVIKVDNTFKTYVPDIVFHAAAYKHVPILQEQSREAVKNNILGTIILTEYAVKYDCEKFIFISTDKAVNPVNILGKSKRVAELYCEYMNQKPNTKFITVRFGNVLGSDGSVIPLFREQIKAGGPVTVTHPDITRYFMTIREASQLILQSCVMGKGGEIYVLDMGEPVKIVYLAEQMITLSGLELGKEIELEYIGLRPGEKLYEELFYSTENKVKTSHNKILLAKHSAINWQELEEMLGELQIACNSFDVDSIEDILNKLIQMDNTDIKSDRSIRLIK